LSFGLLLLVPVIENTKAGGASSHPIPLPSSASFAEQSSFIQHKQPRRRWQQSQQQQHPQTDLPFIIRYHPSVVIAMSAFFFASQQQHQQQQHHQQHHPPPPTSHIATAAIHTHHGGRSRRAPRLATQHSQRQFRGVKSMRELAEAPAVTAFRARFEAGRSFDLDDDLEFCPGLLTEDDVGALLGGF